MSIGIYKIENLVNHKIYIGQSLHIEKRWQEHCQINASSLVGKAIQKYGKQNFSFQILEECEEEKLNEREEFYIHYYKSLVPNGYNIEDKNNGKSSYFLNYSKETLLQIVNDIKFSDLTFKEISSKYGLDLSMIYYLNRGDYHSLSNEKYPLRKTKDFSKKVHTCIDCGVEITKGSERCIQCAHKRQRRSERPSREELKSLIRNESFVTIGKIFGVSDNSIRKWCIDYNLPHKKNEIKKISNDDWNKI